MGKPVVVTDRTFDDLVISADKPVLVDFTADWCPPCKMIAPVLEELAAELDAQLTVGKLDVDQNQRTPHEYGVSGIPTLLLFKGGEPVERIVGFMPKPLLLSKLQPHLN